MGEGPPPEQERTAFLNMLCRGSRRRALPFLPLKKTATGQKRSFFVKKEEIEQHVPGIGSEALDWLVQQSEQAAAERIRLMQELEEKNSQLADYDPQWRQKARRAALDAQLSAAIRQRKGRSEAALRALLPMEELDAAEDSGRAIDEALDKLQAQHGYLFEPALPAAYSGQVGTAPDAAEPKAALRAAFGL